MKPLLLVLVCFSLVGCLGSHRKLSEPVATAGTLDLRDWDLAANGPLILKGWLWDADVLWSPVTGGRPVDLPAPSAAGGPETGGVFVGTLTGDGPRWATLHLRILVDDRESYGFQVGALPGASSVWVNGHRVWRTGVISTSAAEFQPQGMGTLVTLQPNEGVLDIVAQIETADPLVQHPEVNRMWQLGHPVAMAADLRDEMTGRCIQGAFFVLVALAFLWIARLRPDRMSLRYVVAFLLLCFLKLLFNVEQPEPTLGSLLPWLPQSLYLYLNHGLNLAPVPFLVLLLHKLYPEDVPRLAVLAILGVTVVVTLWELFPFVALSLGLRDWYTVVMTHQWSLVLNLFVILAIGFIFERLHHAYSAKRPLAAALFLGGIATALLVLLPIPMSYFGPVKFTYFMGWGIFVFLVALSFDMIRLQVATTNAEIATLGKEVGRLEKLRRFVSDGWPSRLGKTHLEDLELDDGAASETVFVAVRCAEKGDRWFSTVGALAQSHKALMVFRKESTVVWALDSRSETALALALELAQALTTSLGNPPAVVLARALVHYRLLALGSRWLFDVEDLPHGRLEELLTLAQKYGAGVVLDATLQDGLVIGGWRRHRRLTVSGAEIELYQAEEDSLASLKDQSLDDFETALADARAGRSDLALQRMFSVVQHNPFDHAARTHLSDWGRLRRRDVR